MNTTILFNNATAVPAASETPKDPTAIAAERIAAFDADNYAGGTLDLTSPIPAGVRRVQFVQGVPAGKNPVMSSVIEVKDVEQVFAKPYVAPVAQVSTVTITAGAEGTVIVRVIRADAGFKPHERVTVEAQRAGKTKAQLTNELVNKLNAARPRFFTASNSGDDLRITADPFVSFQTALDGVATGWVITATTAPTFGSGTPQQVADLEQYAYGANFTNRIYLPNTPDSYAGAGNYDLHQIMYRTNTTPNISVANKYHQLILAATATSTGIDLQEFFFGVEEAE